MTSRAMLPLQPDGRADDPPEGGSLQFIGTATVLVRLGPFTLLTDPDFLHAGDRAHLGYGVTSRRLTDPALDVDELPPLDAIVLSHLHGDHWDDAANEELSRDLPVLTTRSAARALRRRGFRQALGMATWDQVVLRRGGSWLRLTAVPARHGPRLLRAALPPVNGTIWEVGHGEGPTLYRLYVSGDTVLAPALREIPRRWPHLDLGIFHLGGVRVLGTLLTLDAAQGIEAVQLLAPRVTVPVHHEDYAGFRSPIEDFALAVRDAGLWGRVVFLARGERYAFRFGAAGRAAPGPRRAARAAAHAGNGVANPGTQA